MELLNEVCLIAGRQERLAPPSPSVSTKKELALRLPHCRRALLKLDAVPETPGRNSLTELFRALRGGIQN